MSHLGKLLSRSLSVPGLAPLLLRVRTSNPLILMYHGIGGDEPPSGLNSLEAKHIPGAIFIPTADFYNKKGVVTDLAPAEQIAASLGKAGVKQTDTIVFYDDSGSLSATRAVWSLDVYGHKDSRVLNGTWTSWDAAKKPATKDVPTRAATQYAFSGAPNTSIVVTMDQMVKAVGDPSKIVCDSRTADEYTGRDLRAPAKNGGHVPGALNLAYSDAVAKTV